MKNVFVNDVLLTRNNLLEGRCPDLRDMGWWCVDVRRTPFLPIEPNYVRINDND